jgi:hypothetical protein
VTVQPPQDRYRLTNRPGVRSDLLHRNPGEQCNLDDSERDEAVDEATALALVATGTECCQHCMPGGLPGAVPTE